jgi:hypothetical protein
MESVGGFVIVVVVIGTNTLQRGSQHFVYLFVAFSIEPLLKMKKLDSYFQERRRRFGRKKEELKFPELTPEEEKEIREYLGIKKTVSVEQLVTSTLRKFKEVELVKENEQSLEGEEDYQEVGTVRIKSPGGPERLGTLRIKKNSNNDEDYGTVRIYSLPTQPDSSAEKSMHLFGSNQKFIKKRVH